MKKNYETPCAEAIKFNYRDQVVAASGGIAAYDTGSSGCTVYDPGNSGNNNGQGKQNGHWYGNRG